MIITQTPFRMSFFGGGTDMENFFKEHGGAVLSTTFDKYCYVNGRQKGWERENPATDLSNPSEKTMDGFVEVTEQMELPF